MVVIDVVSRWTVWDRYSAETAPTFGSADGQHPAGDQDPDTFPLSRALCWLLSRASYVLTAEMAAALQDVDDESAPRVPNRWFALIVVCAGTLMVILDENVVNVAMPSIRRDLGFAQADLAWVVNAYLIGFGGLLLLAGRLGDLIGRRRIFVMGLALFTTASMVCGLAQNQVTLIAARFAQGIGGAMIAAMGLGMIAAMFPDPRERAKAIGMFSFVQAGAGSIGLLVGGVLTQATSWHWIFFVNVPIGILAAVVATRLLVRDQGIGIERGADVPGAVLLVGALMLAGYTIAQTTEHGWASAHTLGFGVVAVALLGVFVLRESVATSPLVPRATFRSRALSAANVINPLTGIGLFGMFFLGALYLQRVLGYEPVEVGLAFLPVAVSIGVLSLAISPRLIGRFGIKPTLLPGLALIAIGLWVLQRAPDDAAYLGDVVPALLLLGIGTGLSIPSLMTLAMSSATADDSGLRSGLFNTSQQLGGALGLATLTALATRRTDALVGEGVAERAALTDGYHLAFTVGAGVLVVAILLALVLVPSPRRVADVATPEEGPAATPEPEPTLTGEVT